MVLAVLKLNLVRNQQRVIQKRTIELRISIATRRPRLDMRKGTVVSIEGYEPSHKLHLVFLLENNLLN